MISKNLKLKRLVNTVIFIIYSGRNFINDKKISKIYLNNWAAKDVVSLEELLSDDCILKDWEVELTSKKKF